MMQQHGILLGKHEDGSPIFLPGGPHVGLHAPTESGKGISFVIPNCFTWEGSLVVLDIKGEAWDATAGHRAFTLGQDVYLFEPASESLRSHRWNPFAEVQRGSLDRFKRISMVANLIFPDMDLAGQGSNDNKFWDRISKKAFSAVAFLLAESPEERLHIDRIAQLFTRSDGADWLAERIEQRRAKGDPYSAIAVDRISDFVGDDDPKLRGEVRQSVSTALQTWSDDPQLCAVTSESDFRLSDLRRRPMTIYVVVEPGDIPRLKPLLRLFFDQAIALNTVGTPRKDPSLTCQTLFLLDEFARLGRSDSLAHAAQYVRGYGLRMAYVVQDRSQLRAIYGHDVARDIFSNLGAEVLFGATDQELAKEVEERLGDNTIQVTSRSRPRFWSSFKISRHSESDQPQRRPLMLDQEILQMSRAEQIIFGRGAKPSLTRRYRWFEEPEFTSRVLPPPKVPKLDISIALDNGSTKIRRQNRTLERRLP